MKGHGAMKHVVRIALLGFLVLAFGTWSKESPVAAAGSWKSPGISVHQASCHPHCQMNYAGDPVPIRVVAPDGLDPRTARLECSGNGCQFDHGDVVLHDANFIGTWYSRSEAVTVYAVADWK
jgi:hypothetical protein